jgi:RHS repeat-associated protein
VDRFIHGPRGIHAHQDNSGEWFYPMQDGLGSVRGVVDEVLAVQGIQHYEPYGVPFGAQGSLGMPFAFTGEMRDPIGLQYHRARYYQPAMGGWLSLDPFEGMAQRPMSLNGYSWVEGNPVTNVDPSGHCVSCLVAAVAGISFLLSGCSDNPTQFTPNTKCAKRSRVK